jgi:phosphatidylglycerol:prolipoprotein diacylglycerol transferase
MRMVPYVTQPALHLGPVTIHAFGAIVALAAFLGLEIGRRRFRRLELDPAIGEGLAWWALVGGFLGAHLFAVLFYFPEKVLRNPLVLLKLWEDLSSFGGMLGGLLGIGAYLRRRAPSITRLTRRRLFDAIAYAFSVALLVGRFACTLAHDHPGTLSKSPLAISLATAPAQEYITQVYNAAGRTAELPAPDELARLGFNDLGWYEFLYLGVVVVPVILLLGRRRPQHQRPGTLAVAFLALYLPVRFLLDFLRVSDVRYVGLTPAQWVILLVFVPLAIYLRRPVVPELRTELSGTSTMSPKEDGSL